MIRVIERPGHLGELRRLLRQFPVVAILGARQVGKTTLARQLVAAHRGQVTYLDLENPDDAALLAEPLLALRRLRGLVVVDEVQRRPGLFPVLRVLVDEARAGRRFLVLGSASPDLLQQSSESLAGRIAYHELGGFSVGEVGAARAEALWRRGGFPRALLAPSEAESLRWRRELIGTFLARDIPALGLRPPAPTLRRFWLMLAHWHGQIWNGAEFASSFGVAHTTIQRYLDVLSATFMVRQLPAWHENLAKRQVKAPKVYVRDSGLLHALLGLRTQREIESHPKLGASFEGFALETVVDRLGALPEECFFWASHGGAELDLLVVRGQRRLGFEFKRTSTPAMTRSMHVALADLRLDSLDVVHPGARTFPLGARVRAVALERVLEDVAGLR
ncbi:MAG: ATP-binding protein [Deltaproteobacteria bacterium]|nr:ATP-binding protein [Deltaproteobacteria bacterium]